MNNIPALGQIMAWHWPDNKPLSGWCLDYQRIYASLSFNELTDSTQCKILRHYYLGLNPKFQPFGKAIVNVLLPILLILLCIYIFDL